jgi:electron transfer flavoprotein beta subunit
MLAIDPVRGNVDWTGVRFILNPHDEHAVEEAIRLRGRFEEGKVIVITLGPEDADEVLRYCLAMGADDAVHICDVAYEGSDVLGSARVLAKAIFTQSYDLVLCGRQASGWSNGAVGAATAEFLDLPMVAAITHLEVSLDGKTAVVERIQEYGAREVVRCPLPALFTVDAAINRLRYVSVCAQQKVRGRAILRRDSRQLGIPLEQVGSAASMIRFEEFSPPKPKKVFTPASTLPAAERLRLIMSGGIVANRESEFLEGSPDDIAAQVVGFLIKESIISCGEMDR